MIKIKNKGMAILQGLVVAAMVAAASAMVVNYTGLQQKNTSRGIGHATSDTIVELAQNLLLTKAFCDRTFAGTDFSAAGGAINGLIIRDSNGNALLSPNDFIGGVRVNSIDLDYPAGAGSMPLGQITINMTYGSGDNKITLDKTIAAIELPNVIKSGSTFIECQHNTTSLVTDAVRQNCLRIGGTYNPAVNPSCALNGALAGTNAGAGNNTQTGAGLAQTTGYFDSRFLRKDIGGVFQDGKGLEVGKLIIPAGGSTPDALVNIRQIRQSIHNYCIDTTPVGSNTIGFFTPSGIRCLDMMCPDGNMLLGFDDNGVKDCQPIITNGANCTGGQFYQLETLPGGGITTTCCDPDCSDAGNHDLGVRFPSGTPTPDGCGSCIGERVNSQYICLLGNWIDSGQCGSTTSVLCNNATASAVQSERACCSATPQASCISPAPSFSDYTCTAGSWSGAGGSCAGPNNSSCFASDPSDGDIACCSADPTTTCPVGAPICVSTGDTVAEGINISECCSPALGFEAPNNGQTICNNTTAGTMNPGDGCTCGSSTPTFANFSCNAGSWSTAGAACSGPDNPLCGSGSASDGQNICCAASPSSTCNSAGGGMGQYTCELDGSWSYVAMACSVSSPSCTASGPFVDGTNFCCNAAPTAICGSGVGACSTLAGNSCTADSQCGTGGSCNGATSGGGTCQVAGGGGSTTYCSISGNPSAGAVSPGEECSSSITLGCGNQASQEYPLSTLCGNLFSQNACDNGDFIRTGHSCTGTSISGLCSWNGSGGSPGTCSCAASTPPSCRLYSSSSFSAQPASNNSTGCIEGNYFEAADTSTQWGWECRSTDGLISASCFANMLPSSPDDGECRTDYTGTYLTQPASDDASGCNLGLYFDHPGDTSTTWTWDCVGTVSTESCTANRSINGSCGTSGEFSSLSVGSPGLCALNGGSPINFVDNGGYWTWNCEGSGGGTNSPQCSADKVLPDPYTLYRCNSSSWSVQGTCSELDGALCSTISSYNNSEICCSSAPSSSLCDTSPRVALYKCLEDGTFSAPSGNLSVPEDPRCSDATILQPGESMACNYPATFDDSKCAGLGLGCLDGKECISNTGCGLQGSCIGGDASNKCIVGSELYSVTSDPDTSQACAGFSDQENCIINDIISSTPGPTTYHQCEWLLGGGSPGTCSCSATAEENTKYGCVSGSWIAGGSCGNENSGGLCHNINSGEGQAVCCPNVPASSLCGGTSDGICDDPGAIKPDTLYDAQPYDGSPTAYGCLSGTFDDSTPDTASNWNWSCLGSGGGADVSCSLLRGEAGSCGAAARKTRVSRSSSDGDLHLSPINNGVHSSLSSSAPDLCASGTLQNFSYDSSNMKWTWDCLAEGSASTDDECEAWVESASGECNSFSTGVYDSIPANACASGTITEARTYSIHGYYYWRWNCAGSHHTDNGCFADTGRRFLCSNGSFAVIGNPTHYCTVEDSSCSSGPLVGNGDVACCHIKPDDSRCSP